MPGGMTDKTTAGAKQAGVGRDLSGTGSQRKGAGTRSGGSTGARQPGRAPVRAGRPDRPQRPTRPPLPLAPGATGDAQKAVGTTVAGLGYELVELERAARGLLRVTIDRIAGRSYVHGGIVDAGTFITVDDCEVVTRQLQYALEVEGVDYARLEVSSPGLDRPLKTEADYRRFAGQPVKLTLKQPFQGRKAWQGTLQAVGDDGWQLVLPEGPADQALGFKLDEVRDARLVPVLDFKGRRFQSAEPAAQAGETEE